MKLTIIAETFPPEINGVAMTFGHIARELGRRGHQVTVCHPRRDDVANSTTHAEFSALPCLASHVVARFEPDLLDIVAAHPTS